MKDFFEGLLSNPGSKIKSFATWAYLVTVVVSAIGAIVGTFILAGEGYGWMILLLPITVIVAIAITIISAWLGYILLYGLGELIENSGQRYRAPDNYTSQTSDAGNSQAESRESRPHAL